MGGIKAPGLTLCASVIQRARFDGVFARVIAPIGDRVTEVGQIGSDRSVRRRAADRVTSGA